MINQILSESKLFRHEADDIHNDLNYFAGYGHSLVEQDSYGFDKSFIPSPWHGRSQAFIQSKNNKFLVVKGIGCPYLKRPYFNSGEMEGHIWGFVNERVAKSEFDKMLIAHKILNHQTSNPIALKRIKKIEFQGQNPHLIYYEVKNPLRLIDLDFCDLKKKKAIKKEIVNISKNEKQSKIHLLITDKLCEILNKLYSNGLVHNSLSVHNISCSIELVDFESSFLLTDNENLDLKLSVIPRELIQLREIAYSVAWWFNEIYEVTKVDELIDIHRLESFSQKFR
ncbi:MAG: hypothetical protein P8O83_04235 [Flavobacteriaceae bacterium]|nr:hypothetical protein [Flavobacteriaceae bacterium]